MSETPEKERRVADRRVAERRGDGDLDLTVEEFLGEEGNPVGGGPDVKGRPGRGRRKAYRRAIDRELHDLLTE